MISPETMKQLDEMREHLNAGLEIARRLNAPEDEVRRLRFAIGGVTNPAAYDQPTKPSGV